MHHAQLYYIQSFFYLLDYAEHCTDILALDGKLMAI